MFSTNKQKQNMMSGPWDYYLAASILLILTFLTTTEAQSLSSQHTLQGFPSITTYSGKRISSDSVLEISYHGATIAVAEWSPARELLGCELIELKNDEVLQSLSTYSQPKNISFNKMFELMSECEEVDESAATSKSHSIWDLLSIFEGIAPGTKWCGTGDIAKTYSDLGFQTDIDRCCRLHDFCPIRIRAHKTKYELTNNSFYTKMHCSCDDRLFDCLKKIKTTESRIIGTIFFDLEKIPCLLAENGRYRFRAARSGF